MIVTTTNSIEGSEISRYNDPIAANVVIGTTVFSDIAANYVNLFINLLKEDLKTFSKDFCRRSKLFLEEVDF
ncbi:heavy metal-binding domain-containing protein [Sphingobacterium sp. R2]|uniref:heavy metal-binding domain-containing protein n=1 Tax=Sphingobacterium sp. R2 TaxID=3112958 RepID=UPI00345D8DD5